MRKQSVLKTEVTGVFPLIGSPEEGHNKKIRTLKIVGFRFTPGQAIDAATALLTQAKAAQNGEKHTVLDVTARRKEGTSVLQVETAIAPPARRKKPSSKNGQATTGSAAPVGETGEGKKTESAPKRKQPKPARESGKESEGSEAGAAA